MSDKFKLVEEGTPRTLAYGSSMRRDDLKLLEVSEELLQELQDTGLTFKGDINEEAVLCSNTQTFAVKSVGTSNLVLLLDPTTQQSPSTPITVSAISTSHLEVVNIGPRLHALDDLLAQNLITDDTIDNDITTTNCNTSWTNLLETVQASPLELAQALISRGAICLNGQWRSIDQSYLGTILDLLLLTVIEQGWTLHAVPAVDAARVLQQHSIPQELTFYCITSFTDDIDEKLSFQDDDEKERICVDGPVKQPLEGTFSLSEKKVCRFLGIRLLKEQPVWKSSEEFMNEWKKVVPESMTPSIDMLRGQILTTPPSSSSTTTSIQSFPEESLPRDPAKRFTALFAARSKWLSDDIIPFIERLPGPGESIESLLLKYARASQQNPSDPLTYTVR